eukprot:8812787-Alexandrium_andersonii.AAC.1
MAAVAELPDVPDNSQGQPQELGGWELRGKGGVGDSSRAVSVAQQWVAIKGGNTAFANQFVVNPAVVGLQNVDSDIQWSD